MIQAVVLARKQPFLGRHSYLGFKFLPVTTDHLSNLTITQQLIRGPVLSLDLGSKRVGAAVSDPTLVAITKLKALRRSNWKQLLRDVRDLVLRLDAKTIVIGLPLSLDGTEGSAAVACRDVALKFARSLELPIYLQDERLTSVAARERLAAAGLKAEAIAAQIDSESAALILSDFIGAGQQRILVTRPLND
jgi:putative holliday junction resolvase